MQSYNIYLKFAIDWGKKVLNRVPLYGSVDINLAVLELLAVFE